MFLPLTRERDRHVLLTTGELGGDAEGEWRGEKEDPVDTSQVEFWTKVE